jgi:hypothetical protein
MTASDLNSTDDGIVMDKNSRALIIKHIISLYLIFMSLLLLEAHLIPRLHNLHIPYSGYKRKLTENLTLSTNGRSWLANDNVDRNGYSPQRNSYLARHVHGSEINYTALESAMLQRVRCRPKLENEGAGWEENGTHRATLYSKLRPVRYQSHVIAYNKDDTCSEVRASRGSKSAFTYFPMTWSQCLGGSFVALVLWFAYHFRISRLRRSFEAQLEEQTHLAHELQDTLLQTIQGSKLVADNALELSNDLDYMRRAMGRLSCWLERAIDESREGLHSLRSLREERNDLANH